MNLIRSHQRSRCSLHSAAYGASLLGPALAVLANFALQLFDLALERFVFGHLALEKLHGDGCFAVDAPRGEQVCVAQLVAAVAKVARLDQTLVDQGIQAVVGLAEARAQCASKIALAQVRIRFEQPEQAKMSVLHGGRINGWPHDGVCFGFQGREPSLRDAFNR